MPSSTPTPTPTPAAGPILSALSPAELWVGSGTGKDEGLRFDLLAKVYLGNTPVGSGQVDSVPAGAKSFNKAILDEIPLTLTAPVPVAAGDTLALLIMVRNACTGSAQNGGRARLWYNGRPVDGGPKRDAGSRFDATIGGADSNYFLRKGFVLSTSNGTSRSFVEIEVGERCGDFRSLGVWITRLAPAIPARPAIERAQPRARSKVGQVRIPGGGLLGNQAHPPNERGEAGILPQVVQDGIRREKGHSMGPFGERLFEEGERGIVLAERGPG
jgi:hypothetical protein